MPKRIQDEFSSISSRQRRYQLRREKAGQCRLCGNPGSPYCPEHREQARSHARNKRCVRVVTAADLV